jgi:hypothetical protein
MKKSEPEFTIKQGKFRMIWKKATFKTLYITSSKSLSKTKT